MTEDEQGTRLQGLLRLAEVLSRGHGKYVRTFGADPHGTVRQFMAVLELCPEAAEYIRLYEKQREEMLVK